MATKWQYMGDVNMLDYGGKFYRHVAKRRYHFVEVTNMDEACGRDNEGQAKYSVELSEIDLDAIGEKELASAKRSCGWDSMPDSDEALAECCHSYGNRARLGEYCGNNGNKLIREAKAESKLLASDSDAYEAAMDRPVNAIGSTAREFMTGDILAGLSRGVMAGKPDARLMAKMYQVDQVTIDDARPADWVPYMMGYMDSMGKSPPIVNDPDDPTSPEYYMGYERGENVKAGKAPAPGWIKQAKTA
jgi:hypothetical protein